MPSNLPEIVDLIKAFTFNYGTKAVTNRSGDTINNSAEATDLPLRILSAMGTSGGQAVRRTLGAGSVLSMRWEITDILLAQKLDLSRGIKDQSTPLIQYAADYAEAIRSLNMNTYGIDDVSIRPGTVEWPNGSGNFFYGVECVLTMKEIVQ